MYCYVTPVKEGTRRQHRTVCRDGDWVCWQCNNLNFSFRKRCNRCKTQTRQQNEEMYSYYYYPAFTPLTPKKVKQDLPSVSPLLKKYHANHTLTTADPKELFHQDWTPVRDFDECNLEDVDDTAMEEMEKLIGNIII